MKAFIFSAIIISDIIIQGCLSQHSLARQLKDACFQDNPEKIEEILQRGFSIDSPIDENGNTLLRVAATYGSEEVIRLLLKKGASLEAHNKFGSRAIDRPYTHGLTNICELLAIKSPHPDLLIDGIPEPVIEEMFSLSDRFKKKTILEVNWGAAPELAVWLQRKGMNQFVMFRDDMKFEVKTDMATGKEEAFEKKIGAFVSWCKITLVKKRDGSYYEWEYSSWHSRSDDSLNIGCKMKKDYGYWFSNLPIVEN